MTASVLFTDDMKRAVRVLFKRVLNASRIELTHEDVLTLVCSPAAKQAILEASQIVKLPHRGSPAYMYVDWEAGPTLEITMVPYRGKHPPLVPHTPRVQTTDMELFNKVETWVQQRMEFGIQFGRVNRVLELLSEGCTSLEAIRFYFPSVVPLLRIGNQTELADRLTNVKPPKVPATFAPPIKRACVAAGGTVAMALMLSDEAPPEQPVMLSCSNAAPVLLDELWITPM